MANLEHVPRHAPCTRQRPSTLFTSSSIHAAVATLLQLGPKASATVEDHIHRITSRALRMRRLHMASNECPHDLLRSFCLGTKHHTNLESLFASPPRKHWWVYVAAAARSFPDVSSICLQPCSGSDSCIRCTPSAARYCFDFVVWRSHAKFHITDGSRMMRPIGVRENQLSAASTCMLP